MTPIRRLDHVAIAVADTEAALRHFRDRFGLPVVSSEDNVAAGARLTYLDAGNALIQLVAPLRDDAPVARHLAEHGEGLHHLCFGVDDVGAGAAALSQDAAPDITLGSGRGRPSAFVPGAAPCGVRLEVTAFDHHEDVETRPGRLTARSRE